MALLIDGYNLLHATGIVGRGPGPTELHRSREALLNYLADAIRPEDRANAAIVFDAAEAPSGLPKRVSHSGLTVHFARDYQDADTMLRELIRQHHVPRQLTVVSSDHQVQRAARRRKAQAVDSDVWFRELVHARRARDAQDPAPPTKPTGELSADDIAYWVEAFAMSEEELSPRPAPARPTGDAPPSGASEPPPPFDNPFPPGYGDDLLDGHPP